MQLNNRILETSARRKVSQLAVYGQLKQFRVEYPDIDDWFFSKVIPGISDGTRNIFLGAGSSILIAKKTPTERKICTLWVDPEFRRTGIATELMSEAYKWLGTEFPLMTLPATRLPEFDKLLRAHRFELQKEYCDYYRKGTTELAFNGWL